MTGHIWYSMTDYKTPGELAEKIEKEYGFGTPRKLWSGYVLEIAKYLRDEEQTSCISPSKLELLFTRKEKH